MWHCGPSEWGRSAGVDIVVVVVVVVDAVVSALVAALVAMLPVLSRLPHSFGGLARRARKLHGLEFGDGSPLRMNSCTLGSVLARDI